jgi:hypothetical protein
VAEQTGKGNLIIGYDLPPANLQPGARAGSHNLVTGVGNTFTGTGGVVFGGENSQNADYGSILGGSGNEVSGDLSVDVGGVSNIIPGPGDVVVGGKHNGAEGSFTVVLGGSHNSVDGGDGVVVSGYNKFSGGGLTTLGGSNIESAVDGYLALNGGPVGTVISAPIVTPTIMVAPQPTPMPTP